MIDHIEELGNTLSAIAGEKAGIIKPGVPVISALQELEAERTITSIAHAQGSQLYQVERQIQICPGAEYSPQGQYFTIRGRLGTYIDLCCPLLGQHQQMNAAVAIGIIEVLEEAGYSVTPEQIHAGISAVQWPGRMQIVEQHPLLLLDGAHDRSPKFITIV